MNLLLRRLPWFAVPAACLGLLPAVLGEPVRQVRAGSGELDDVVALVAGAGLAAVLGWTLLVLGATALSPLSGPVGTLARVLGGRVAPRAAYRLAEAALGVAVAAGPVAASAAIATAAPAAASALSAALASAGDDEALALGRPLSSPPTAMAASEPAIPAVGRPRSDPPGAGSPGVPRASGWTPERPPPTAPRRRPSAVGLVTSVPRDAEAVMDAVVVRRGDTLWDIAARHLGADATDAEIAAEWPRWYAANRRVVGPDPDLILPGIVLAPPASDGGTG